MTTTTSINQSQASWDWLSGNARLKNLSGQLLGAHIAHAGLIMFWAGSITLLELSNINPDLPLSAQGLLVIPNLARLGWGIGAQGTIINTYPYFVIGILHLAASAVLGAGGLFHVFRGAPVLKDASGNARKFHYEWDDPKQLGLILGHHLIFLGIAALLFVEKAMNWGGIYDPAIGGVCLVTEPNIDPLTIFGFLFGFNHGNWSALGMAGVNTLEDVIGGHIWVSTICILGGIWHILVPSLSWAKKKLTYNADAILSYSLAGVAVMAFTSGYFVAFNDLVFPPELYGSDTSLFAGIQFTLCGTFLMGHIWHGLQSKSQGNDLSEKDKFGAIMAGFVVLAIVVISLFLL